MNWTVKRAFLMDGTPVAPGSTIKILDRSLISSLLTAQRIEPADDATAALLSKTPHAWRDGLISTRCIN